MSLSKEVTSFESVLVLSKLLLTDWVGNNGHQPEINALIAAAPKLVWRELICDSIDC
jgi:hypothetical protein